MKEAEHRRSSLKFSLASKAKFLHEYNYNTQYHLQYILYSDQNEHYSTVH